MKKLAKTISFYAEKENKIVKGVIEGAKLAEQTLGPSGSCVVIEQGGGLAIPKVTKDGVSVVNELFSSDREINMGYQLLKEASINVLKQVGDGTTSVCCLSHKLLEKIKSLSSDPATVNDLTKKILGSTTALTSADIIKELQGIKSFLIRRIESGAITITDKKNISLEDVKGVAYTSSGSMKIAELISEAKEKCGLNAKIIIGPSTDSNSKIEITEGYFWDQGLMSPYLVNNLEKITAEAECSSILLVEDEVTLDSPVVNFLQMFSSLNAKEKMSLTIVASSFNPAFMKMVEGLNAQLFPMNKGVFFVKAPGFGQRRTEMLRDMAALMNTSVFTMETLKMNEDELKEFIVDMPFGAIQIKQYESIISNIVPSSKNEEQYAENLKNLKNAIQKMADTADVDFDKEYYQGRLDKLNGSLVEIQVGGTTETEMKELSDRVDDAVRAVEALMQSGTTTGCGTAYAKLSLMMKDYLYINELSTDDARVPLIKAIFDVLGDVFRRISNENTDNLSNLVKAYNNLDSSKFNPQELNTVKILDPVSLIKNVVDTAFSLTETVMRISAAVSLESKVF